MAQAFLKDMQPWLTTFAFTLILPKNGIAFIVEQPKAIFDATAPPTAAFVAGSVVTADAPEVDKKAARVAIRALRSAAVWAALMNW